MQSLIIRIIVSFLSTHNLNVLFSCILSILVFFVLPLEYTRFLSLGFPFDPRLCFLVWNDTSLSLKMSIHLFFFLFFLFSCYFFYVDHRVVSIVFYGCFHSFFRNLYAVFESSYRCIKAIFNTSNHLPPFHDTYSLSTSYLECKDLCI